MFGFHANVTELKFALCPTEDSAASDPSRNVMSSFMSFARRIDDEYPVRVNAASGRPATVSAKEDRSRSRNGGLLLADKPYLKTREVKRVNIGVHLAPFGFVWHRRATSEYCYCPSQKYGMFDCSHFIPQSSRFRASPGQRRPSLFRCSLARSAPLSKAPQSSPVRP